MSILEKKFKLQLRFYVEANNSSTLKKVEKPLTEISSAKVAELKRTFEAEANLSTIPEAEKINTPSDTVKSSALALRENIEKSITAPSQPQSSITETTGNVEVFASSPEELNDPEINRVTGTKPLNEPPTDFIEGEFEEIKAAKNDAVKALAAKSPKEIQQDFTSFSDKLKNLGIVKFIVEGIKYFPIKLDTFLHQKGLQLEKVNAKNLAARNIPLPTKVEKSNLGSSETLVKPADKNTTTPTDDWDAPIGDTDWEVNAIESTETSPDEDLNVIDPFLDRAEDKPQIKPKENGIEDPRTSQLFAEHKEGLSNRDYGKIIDGLGNDSEGPVKSEKLPQISSEHRNKLTGILEMKSELRNLGIDENYSLLKGTGELKDLNKNIAAQKSAIETLKTIPGNEKVISMLQATLKELELKQKEIKVKVDLVQDILKQLNELLKDQTKQNLSYNHFVIDAFQKTGLIGFNNTITGVGLNIDLPPGSYSKRFEKQLSPHISDELDFDLDAEDKAAKSFEDKETLPRLVVGDFVENKATGNKFEIKKFFDRDGENRVELLSLDQTPNYKSSQSEEGLQNRIKKGEWKKIEDPSLELMEKQPVNSFGSAYKEYSKAYKSFTDDPETNTRLERQAISLVSKLGGARDFLDAMNIKAEPEAAIDIAKKILIVGSSLEATGNMERMHDQTKPIAQSDKGLLEYRGVSETMISALNNGSKFLQLIKVYPQDAHEIKTERLPELIVDKLRNGTEVDKKITNEILKILEENNKLGVGTERVTAEGAMGNPDLLLSVDNLDQNISEILGTESYKRYLKKG